MIYFFFQIENTNTSTETLYKWQYVEPRRTPTFLSPLGLKSKNKNFQSIFTIEGGKKVRVMAQNITIYMMFQ